MEEKPESNILIMSFVTFLIIGCILLPSLLIFSIVMFLQWEIQAVLSVIFLLLSLILGKNLEKLKRAQKIRSSVRSRRTWMSVADYGVTFGGLERRKPKRGQSKDSNDSGFYLKSVLEKSKSEMRIKKL